MFKRVFTIGLFVALTTSFDPNIGAAQSAASAEEPAAVPTVDTNSDLKLPTAVFAGGSFSCVEADFEQLAGVLDVVTGYTGGTTDAPTHESYRSGGHREAVRISYDPQKVNFAGLVEWLLKHCDPTDSRGAFRDRGQSYAPAIYFSNSDEQKTAERILSEVNRMHVFSKRLSISVAERTTFWPSEMEYQDFHIHQKAAYNDHRSKSGRDIFITKHWGTRAQRLEFPESHVEAIASQLENQEPEKNKKTTNNASTSVSEPYAGADEPWRNFRKPSPTQLRHRLSPVQFQVTQKHGTEPAFSNRYWNNHQQGIYVDVVSGEPLFSSSDKFESGTGWPSFVQPLDPDFVVYHQDNSNFTTRIEVRSKIADSHLGHVFTDGPVERGGKRYCINSASLRFIPQSKMEEEGYGQFLKRVVDSGKHSPPMTR